ncbi:fatty acid synthase alpha subunit Lsd1, partial [Coemansia sp. RSA 2559]
MLQKYIVAKHVDVRALRKRYIPNLTAQPFDVTKEYFALVHGITQSSVLQTTLDKWDDSEQDEQALATELVIEVLAYQLASPVQWIDTQNQLLFESLGVRRIVEIGTSSVLCGMANKTLKSYSGFMRKKFDIFHIAQDREAVYYLDKKPEPKPAVEQAAQPKEAAPVAQNEPAPSAVPEEAKDVNFAASFDDEAPHAIDVIAAVIARKFKMEREAVPLDKSIKALAAGKSTLQNEIFGDLHKEFAGKLPNKVEDLVLSELAASVGGFDGQLGKHTQTQVTRLFSSKMPGGFSMSAARSLLQSSYGLGPKRQDAVLLYALASEPKARLGSDAEAHQWIGGLATRYAKQAGISLSSKKSAGGSSTASGPMVSSAAMDALQKKQTDFARQQMEVLAHYAGVNMHSANIRADQEKAKNAGLQTKLDMLENELGDDFTEGVIPRFDTRKAHRFDSSWSWARQDAYDWIQQDMLGNIPNDPYVLATRVLRMRNCADTLLLGLLEGMASVLEKQQPQFLKALELACALRDACKQAMDSEPAYKETTQPLQPETKVVGDGVVDYKEIPRTGEPSFSEYIYNMQASTTSDTTPCLYLKERSTEDSARWVYSTRWVYSPALSSTYYTGLDSICVSGLSFAGKTALVTGCGKGSIGFDIVRGLLAGRAKVVATTSSYSRRTILSFESLYQECGARGSELIVVPFNQGSIQDTRQLIDYIFEVLGWDLDYVVPFATVSDLGSFATSIGSKSEFSQRVMLTNVIRLLGGIKDRKEKQRLMFRATFIVLPLSPNHGTFGGDGLYGECKAALETLLNRWQSEDWRNYMAIAGTFIGWVRGTGLMAQNNHIAQDIECSGARIFTTREMAFNILGLMNPHVHAAASKCVICAEFDGRLGAIGDLSCVAGNAKRRLEKECSVKQLAFYENIQGLVSHYQDALNRTEVAAEELYALAQHDHCFPKPQKYESLEHLWHLQDTVNLDKVVVITGYGEVGPYGHAETRWQMEAFGELTMAGCIELAWIMGLIKHVNGPLPGSGKHYIGWVDAKSNEPVKDEDVKSQYLEYILAHTGIRLIEPDMAHGFDPEAKTFLREVQIEHDMDPFETTFEDAQEYKNGNKDKVEVWEISEVTWSVRFLKGAVIRVPVAISTDRLVAGLIPTGWNPKLFGIPDDIIKQVDMVTIYTLVATVEALVRSGITDPYELYKHFHVSEVGSSMGSGFGGGLSTRRAVKSRFLEHEANMDVIQETFISTIQAWVNMLLMSCSGPIKPVVGACATGLLSVDVAIETI